MSPVPSFCNILRSLLPLKKADLTPWFKSNQKHYWFSKSSQTLGIIAELCVRIKKEEKAILFFPSYMCNDALKYIRCFPVKIIFYPLNQDLSLNKEEFMRLASFYKPDLVHFVHYFGIENNASFLCEYCDKNSVLLVEDAVHCIKPINSIGCYGDFVIFSPHKHLPVPEGALLVINERSKLKFDAQNNLELLDNLIQEYYTKQKKCRFKNTFWYAKRTIQKLGITLYPSKSINNVNDPLIMENASYKISNFSKNLILEEAKSIDGLVERRSRIKIQISSILKIILASKNISICDEMSGIYYLKLKSFDHSLLDDIYNTFINSGLPVLRWPDLPPEVIADSFAYDDTTQFFNSHLFIPTHQSFSLFKLNRALKKILRNEFGGWSYSDLNYENWDLFAQKIKKPMSLTQAWEYGEAKKKHRKSVLRKVVFNSERKPVCIVQLTKKNLIGNFVGLVRINRGPTIASDQACHQSELTLMAIGFICSLKFGYNFRLLSIAPQLSVQELVAPFFRLNSLHRLPYVNYITGYLPLNLTEDKLFNNLNPKWRNLLRKSIKNGLVVNEEKIDSESVLSIRSSYEAFQINKNFQGISSELLVGMALHFDKSRNFRLFNAMHDGHLVGQLVTVGSANTVTYLLSVTSDLGKSLQANTYLLWRSIISAHNNSYMWYDLGGLNSEKIAHFKKGVNPEIYEYVGEWFNFV